jgi:alpha-tubulin suppressor-like RCC1 family protein
MAIRALFITLILCTGQFSFAAITWDGGGADNNWSSALNWSSDSVPLAADTVIFDGTSSKPCVVNISANVNSVNLANSFAGNIVIGDGANLTVGVLGYSQSGGEFNSGNGQFILYGGLQLLGGTLNTSNGNLDIMGNMNMLNGTVTSGNSILDVDGNFSISNGTFQAPLETTIMGNVDFTGGTFTAPGATGNLRVGGDFTRTSGTYTHNNGNLEFNGDGVMSGSISFYNMTISGNFEGLRNFIYGDFNITSSGNVKLGDTTYFYGNFNNQGLFNHNYRNTNFYNTGTISSPTPIQFHYCEFSSAGTTTFQASEVQVRSGFYVYNNHLIDFGNTKLVVIDTNLNFYDYNGTPSPINHLEIRSGDFRPQNDIIVSGNWVNNSNYTHGNHAVTFSGNNQQISGNNTFYDFIKTTTNDTLYFQAGTTQTVTNFLTLQGGGGGQFLYLYSSTPSTQWKIDPQGGRSVNSVFVKDSHNTNASPIAALNSFDDQNNINWSIDSPFKITLEDLNQVPVKKLLMPGEIEAVLNFKLHNVDSFIESIKEFKIELISGNITTDIGEYSIWDISSTPSLVVSGNLSSGNNDGNAIHFDFVNQPIPNGNTMFQLRTEVLPNVTSKQLNFKLRNSNIILTSGNLIIGTYVESPDIYIMRPTENRAAIASSQNHNLVLDAGALMTSGFDNFGETGNGESVPMLFQVGVKGDWNAVAAGEEHSMGLDSAGNIFTWGNNKYGQLGDNSNNNISSPNNLSTIGPALNIYTGSHSSFALTDSGQLYAWGRNQSGQLGKGDFTPSNIPLAVPLPTGNIMRVSVGIEHVLCIIDGDLYGWGNNGYGQLGSSSNTVINVPTLIDNTITWIDIFAGGFHSTAISHSGNLYVWGKNNKGQLGLGHTSHINIPTISSISDATMISAGNDHTLMIKKDGSLWGAGGNDHYQIDSTRNNHLYFVQIGNLLNYEDIIAAHYITFVYRNGESSFKFSGKYLRQLINNLIPLPIVIPD